MKKIIAVIPVLAIVIALVSCNSSSQKDAQEVQEEQRAALALQTNYGTITLELYNETPRHRDNFLKLAREHKFDSLLFHRVIDNFMIQTGDPDSKNASPQDTLGEGDLEYTVPAEFNPKLYHKKGALGAARDDNPEKASSAMQFYIVKGRVYTDSTLNASERRVNASLAVDYYKTLPNKSSLLDSVMAALENNNYPKYLALSDTLLTHAMTNSDYRYYYYTKEQREVYKSLGGTPWLDQGYTVYGQVTSGQAVVDSIGAVATTTMDRPIEPVRILSVTVLNDFKEVE